MTETKIEISLDTNDIIDGLIAELTDAFYDNDEFFAEVEKELIEVIKKNEKFDKFSEATIQKSINDFLLEKLEKDDIELKEIIEKIIGEKLEKIFNDKLSQKLSKLLMNFEE